MKSEKSEILETVRATLDDLLQHKSCIKLTDVREHLQKRNLYIGDSSLRKAVYQLLENGYIQEIQQSSGRKPALYSKSSQETQPQQSTVVPPNTQIGDNGNTSNPENIKYLKNIESGTLKSSELEKIRKDIKPKTLKLAELEREEEEINQKITNLKNRKLAIQEEKNSILTDIISRVSIISSEQEEQAITEFLCPKAVDEIDKENDNNAKS